jgi:4-hydroxy-tetrahydrodipicolinate synthase
MIERQVYPINAKYFLQLEGLHVGLDCRCARQSEFTSANRAEVEQLQALTREYCIEFGV